MTPPPPSVSTSSIALRPRSPRALRRRSAAQATPSAAVGRVVRWYVEHVYRRFEGPGTVPFYCDPARVGHLAVDSEALARGDADAGIVYLTDARATAGVDTVEIPAADNAEASYPIAVVNTTANRDLAAAFVDLVSGPAGRAALVAEGFIAP